MKTPAQKSLDTLKKNYSYPLITTKLDNSYAETYFCEKCEDEKHYLEIDIIKSEFICKNCQEVENYPF